MKVIEQIAHSNFGRVERVLLDDGTVAARKVFEPNPVMVQAAQLPDLRKRFAREVKVQGQLPSHLAVPVMAADLKCEPVLAINSPKFLSAGDFYG
jgi:hypothetical protein